MLPTKIYAPNDQVGPYAIVGMLGQGGSGCVYAARDLDSGTVFALKVSRYDLRELDAPTRETLKARLEREFTTLMLCPHRYIVPVFAYGICGEEGMPYLAMELLAGQTLDSFLKQDHSGLRVRLELFQKVVQGIAHLHQKGIVHRDLKPHNIWVRTNGDPAVFDFGIVSAPWLDTMTPDREVLGTALYMSPEAFGHTGRGHYRPQPTDDVYALGVLLYRMLTGQMPYDSLAEMLFKKSPPPHPCELAPLTPRALGDLAMKLLSRNPSQRPQNARALLEELTPATVAVPLAPTPGEATEPVSVPDEAAAVRRFRRKGLLLRAAGILGLLFLVLAGTTALKLALRAKPGEVATVQTSQPNASVLPPVGEQWTPSSPSDAQPGPLEPLPPNGPEALVPSHPHRQLTDQARHSMAPERSQTRLTRPSGRDCHGGTRGRPTRVRLRQAQMRTDESFMNQCPEEARATSRDLRLRPEEDIKADLRTWMGQEQRKSTPLIIKDGPVEAFVFGPTQLAARNSWVRPASHPKADRVSIQIEQIVLKDGTKLPICAVAYTLNYEDLGPGIVRYPPPGMGCQPGTRQKYYGGSSAMSCLSD